MRKLHTTLMLLVMVLLTSCFYNELPEGLAAPNVLESKITLDVETRSETYEGEQLDQEYFVTATDLENYVKFRREESKRPDLSVKEVVSYGFDNSQTLFYILNYDEGWEVIAADKRVQPTLAHGENGSFTMNTDNEPMKFWMNKLANGVLQQRQVVDSEMSTRAETTEEETSLLNEHVAFWDYISPSDASTRIIINIPIKEPHLPPSDSITIGIQKKYYLNHIQDSSIETDYYGPYIETSWGQEHPWNRLCPYIIENEHALVGCVAVAAGQLLYYLVDKYDLEITTYKNILCTGLYPNHTLERVLPSTELWQEMAISYRNSISDGNSIYSASLLSDIGDKIGTEYGLEESTCYTSNIKTHLLSPLGINSYYIDYNQSTVIDELKNRQMPVIIDGSEFNASVGHAWIIDGYMVYKHNIRNYYIWSSADLTSADLRNYTKEDADGFDLSYTISYYFHMNWGWNGSYNSWYSINTNDWEPGDTTYNCNLDILYGFTIQ